MNSASSASSTPYIDVQGVSVAVGREVMLAPTTLNVPVGECVVFRGQNGAGKTTLLRVLAGAIAPTSGRANIDGELIDERRPKFRRAVAALIGTPPQARDLTVQEHLEMVSVSWGLQLRTAREAATHTLERLDIASLRRRFPHELSSGQTQLLSLGMVLSRPFDILILDEPEQRLDADRLGHVAEILKDLAKDKKTLLVASHSATLSEQIADRTLWLGAEPA